MEREKELRPELIVTENKDNSDEISILKGIREKLSKDPSVYVAGELPVLIQKDTWIGYCLERVKFFISPNRKNYRADYLTRFSKQLLPEFQRTEFVMSLGKFNRHDFEKYGEPYWSLHLEPVYFTESVGIRRSLTDAVQDIPLDKEAFEKWGLDTTLRGKAHEKTINRLIQIEVYPDRRFADLLFRYNSFIHDDTRLAPVLNMLNLDPLSRNSTVLRFDRMQSTINAWDFSDLNSGSLEKRLNELISSHKQTSRG